MRKRNSENPKGQISIMLAVMTSTFILLFAFVINIGMLVNAKINLQNAADLAAYAGAAVQARQLTQIAYLNYEMRRQYKKFLFRVYVLGNMAQDSFPATPPGGIGPTPMQYISDSRTNTNYGAPITCVIFNSENNYCHLNSLPKIAIPPPSFLDAVTDTLAGQLQAIEAIRQQNCKFIGTTNLMLNTLWMYNADPTLANMTNTGLDQVQTNTLGTLQTLATGLGIVPRELILRERIKTLQSYINTKPNKGATKSMVDGMRGKPDTSPGFERTAQAFYSAYYTLGNHTFAGGDVQLDELIPSGADGAMMLSLKDIKQSFTIWAIDYNLGTGGPGGDINTTNLAQPIPQGADCQASAVPIGLPRPLTVGVYKDPSVLTYYAVRLTATAQVLFSPFGPIQMKAYSAAKPFGSRIGPPLEGDENSFFGGKSDPPSNNSAGIVGTSNLAPFLPNLPVREQDGSTRGAGWDTQEVLGAFYQALGSPGSGTNGIGSADIERAYQVAMAPSPWEMGRYTIMSDQGVDDFVKNFGVDNVGAFWAPVFAPGVAGQASNFEDLINAYFEEGVKGIQGNTGGDSDQNANQSKLRETIKKSLTTYLNTYMRSGEGENNEGVNIVRIVNPFFIPPNPRGGASAGGGPFTVYDATKIKTSWNTDKREDYQKNGRNGYSVKFVTFDSLTKNKLTSNGSAIWTNSLVADPEGSADIPFLKH